MSVEDSGVKAKCIYCDKVLKADSKRNGTSRLRRHIIGCHKIEFAGSLIIKKRQSKNKNELASTHNQDKDQASPDCHRFNSSVRAASANGPSHQVRHHKIVHQMHMAAWFNVAKQPHLSVRRAYSSLK